MSRLPVWQSEVSLLCSSQECWELFALSASASGQLSFAVSGCTRTHKLPASYFMLHPVKSTAVPVLRLQLFMASEQLWMEAGLASGFVPLNPRQTDCGMAAAWSGWRGVKLRYYRQYFSKCRNKTGLCGSIEHTSRKEFGFLARVTCVGQHFCSTSRSLHLTNASENTWRDPAVTLFPNTRLKYLPFAAPPRALQSL